MRLTSIYQFERTGTNLDHPTKYILKILRKQLRTFTFKEKLKRTLGWSKSPVSSQTDKLMAGTKFSDYLGLNHYKKLKKSKKIIHLQK